MRIADRSVTAKMSPNRTMRGSVSEPPREGQRSQADRNIGEGQGKVLVSSDEQIKRLNAARLQLDIMRVAGIIVARSDAEAATLLENRTDERDQPFIYGATNTNLPSYRVGYLAILRRLHELGIDDVRGHLLFAVSEAEYRAAFEWFGRAGLAGLIAETAAAFKEGKIQHADTALDKVDGLYAEIWQAEAGLKTYGEAVADEMRFRASEGQHFDMGVDEWLGVRKPVVALRREREGRSDGHPNDLGLRAAENSRRLLPGEGRPRVRHRQVAGGGPLRRPRVDGDQDGGPPRGANVRGSDSRRLPGQDAGVQPVAVVQLGHDRHDR